MRKKEIQLNWKKGPELRVGPKLEVQCDFEKLPTDFSVYCIVRVLQSRREVLYVGYTENLQRRIVQHAGNAHLLRHIKNAGKGRKYVIYVDGGGRSSDAYARSLRTVEKALIQYFVIHGGKLFNTTGTKLDYDSIINLGARRMLSLPDEMYWKRSPSVEIDEDFLLLEK